MLFFIILFGLLLRLSFINKPEGLWNDEYVSWFVANTSEGFWQEVFKQCHMPLYYLYLKPFTQFSDIVLRLTSVIPGVIAVWIMYLTGREFSKKAALYSALITSVLSFLVYYSQEVRFYSLLFLFSALSLLYTVRVIKNASRRNIVGYAISLTLILFTHIIGVVYVFFNLLYVVYKKRSLPLWILFLPILALPFLPAVLKMLPSSQWWGHFSYTNILFLITDYFSPILTNNVNAPPVFFYNKSLSALLIFPSVIACLAIARGFKRGLFFIAFGTVVVLAVAAAAGKLVFITKYSIEILPIFILLMSLGFEKMQKTGTVLLTVFVLFHIMSFFTPYYVTKLPRSDGHRIVGEILNRQDANNVIFTYYEPDRFYRYANLSGKNTYFISKINRFEYLENPSLILKKVPIGESVSVVFLDSVSFFDENFVTQNQNNPKIPEMFLTFSKIKNSLIRTLNDDFTDFEVAKLGSWTIIKARRFR